MDDTFIVQGYTSHMMGKPGTAPCGHYGEHIVGTYVKCLMGCDQPKKPVTRRGRPGHVDQCACGPCQISRRGKTLLVKSKSGGTLIHYDWDGIIEKFDCRPQDTGRARNFYFLDDEGKTVAEGTLDSEISGNLPVHVVMQFLMDRANKVTVGLVQEKPSRVRKFDAKDLKVSFQGVELKPCPAKVVCPASKTPVDKYRDIFISSFRNTFGMAGIPADLGPTSNFGRIIEAQAQAFAKAFENE